MKQIIAKTRTEAEAYVSIGRDQRRAFWKERGKICRFERLPGMEPTWSEDANGLWWAVGITVEQQINAAEAAAVLGALGGKVGGRARTPAKQAASRANGRAPVRQGSAPRGRPKAGKEGGK